MCLTAFNNGNSYFNTVEIPALGFIMKFVNGAALSVLYIDSLKSLLGKESSFTVYYVEYYEHCYSFIFL